MFLKIVFVLSLIAIGETLPLFSNYLSSKNSDDELKKSENEPNDDPIKKSIKGLAEQKNTYLSLAPMLIESVFHEPIETGDKFIKNKIQSIATVSKNLVSIVQTAGKLAVGLAVSGVQKVTNGVKVIKGIVLKPVFLVVGSKMKLLGGGLNVLGSGTKLFGSALSDAGKSVKSGAGFGSTVIDKRTDKHPIDTRTDSPIDWRNDDSPKSKRTDRPPIDWRIDSPIIASTPPPGLDPPEKRSNSSLLSMSKPQPTYGPPILPNHY